MKKDCVEIRNRTLRDHLLKYHDADGDGFLTAEDLQTVKRLRIGPVTGGIQGDSGSFSEEEMIIFGEKGKWEGEKYSFTETEDLSCLPELRELVIFGMRLERISLNHTKLRDVRIRCCELYAAEFGERMTCLRTIVLSECCLQRLVIAPLKGLKKICVAYNSLRRIQCSELSGLVSLDCSYNCITGDFPLARFPRLIALDCSSNGNLEKLDSASCPHLAYLNCGRCNLNRLNVGNNPRLKALGCSGNDRLTSLDLRGAARLRHLECKCKGIKNLDISACSELLTAGLGDRIESLYVSSGFVQNKTLYHWVLDPVIARSPQKPTDIYVDRIWHHKVLIRIHPGTGGLNMDGFPRSTPFAEL